MKACRNRCFVCVQDYIRKQAIHEIKTLLLCFIVTMFIFVVGYNTVLKIDSIKASCIHPTQDCLLLSLFIGSVSIIVVYNVFIILYLFFCMLHILFGIF